MDFGMGIMIDVFLIGCGLYMLYSGVSMMRGGDIPKPLLPASVEPAVMREKKDFTRAIGKKTMILGTAAIVCGGVDIINEKYLGNTWVNLTVSAVFVLITIWYCLTVRKLYK